VLGLSSQCITWKGRPASDPHHRRADGLHERLASAPRISGEAEPFFWALSLLIRTICAAWYFPCGSLFSLARTGRYIGTVGASGPYISVQLDKWVMVLRNYGRGRPLNAPAAFIHACQPIVAKQPPAGPGWAHELKHDGYRLLGHVRNPTYGNYSASPRI
jgi:hypothetical protein